MQKAMRKTLENSEYYFRCLHGIVDSAPDPRPNTNGDYTPLCDREWFSANKSRLERNLGCRIGLDVPSRALDILNECLEHAKK